MSPEVAKLAYRAIIDYMGGDIKRYIELVNKAKKMYYDEYTCECGAWLIDGTIRHGKEEIKILLCTNCGQVYKDGKKIMKIRGRMVC